MSEPEIYIAAIRREVKQWKESLWLLADSDPEYHFIENAVKVVENIIERLEENKDVIKPKNNKPHAGK